MKLGTSISSAAHLSLLLWGALSFQGVKTFEVAEVEALPVDFIPIESITRSIEGERDAKRAEKPAPTQTKKQNIDAQAQNVGDTQIDKPPKVEAPAKLEPVESSASAPNVPDVKELEPVKVNEPLPKSLVADEETPVPTTEIASLNEPPVPITEEKSPLEPAPQETEKAEDGEKFAKLPDIAPLPQSRPRPPEPKSAKTLERKKPDEIKRAIKKAASRKNKQSADDKIAALLNKQDPVATGAKSSSKRASLGSKKSNRATRLSRSEMDALRGAIEQCWNVPIGLSDAEDMRVTITMNLDKDGSIDGRVKVDASGGESRARRAFSESARRAVLKCAPYNLPIGKYDTWSKVVVNFDPSQMF